MLKVAGLSIVYGRVPAVRDIDLQVDEGEVVALVGANGAGKTTTLYGISGTRRIVAGTITFQGRSLVDKAPDEIVRGGIALVPENRRIFGSLTVGENLRLAASVRSRAIGDAGIARVIKLFPILERYWKRPAGALSGGEQQQLAIARALVTEPRLLMLDEPSLGLAPLVVDSVFELLAELKRNGQTILLVEQKIQKALTFADRTYIMRTGRISLHKTRDELAKLDRSVIEDAFFGSLITAGDTGADAGSSGTHQ
jgi:branched-chain amino acid transport system ATP-binding protein